MFEEIATFKVSRILNFISRSLKKNQNVAKRVKMAPKAPKWRENRQSGSKRNGACPSILVMFTGILEREGGRGGGGQNFELIEYSKLTLVSR